MLRVARYTPFGACRALNKEWANSTKIRLIHRSRLFNMSGLHNRSSAFNKNGTGTRSWSFIRMNLKQFNF